MKNFGLSLRGARGRFTLGICLASLLALLVSDSRAAAQQGKFITQASTRLTKLIDDANGDGYKLQNNKFSVGGGWIKQGKENWVGLFTVQLTAGKAYRFLAAGDADAKDVDLQVTDIQGEKVFAKDTATDPQATVDFTPKTTARYLVRVRLYESRDDLPCVCLAIVLSK